MGVENRVCAGMLVHLFMFFLRAMLAERGGEVGDKRPFVYSLVCPRLLKMLQTETQLRPRC